MSNDLILSFDPFEGDFGAPGDTVFSNAMVVARKPGPCSHCGLEICKGERVRRQTSKFDGELMTHRWCALCCAAMAAYEAQTEDEERDELPDYEMRGGLSSKAREGGS